MVLWKKQSSSSGDACYIDLLSETEQENARDELAKSMCEGTNKDDDISIDLRMEGNQRFKQQKWTEAMELYNRSLRYAPDGSENISLSYANRSSCFFHMEKYDQCLADIELARKANYPDTSIRIIFLFASFHLFLEWIFSKLT